MPENDLHRSLEIHKGLVEVSALINGITNREALLREVLDVARRVIGAEAASIFLLEEESGNLRLEMDAWGGGWVERPGIVVPRGAGIAGWVFETGKAQLIPDAYAEARFFKEADKVTGFRTRSILCAPLIAGSRTIGVLQVLNPAAKEAFDAVELEGLVAHANLAATAIGKLQALERERERERLERDLAVAAEIQRELLARAIPQTLSGVVFAAHNVPAAWVGGDFYGVFPRGDGDVDFVIGDVSGKGMPAALLMAQTLSALPFVFQAAGGPAEALGLLNRTFSEGMVRGMFITVLAGRMRPSRREVMLASAGHPSPVVVDAVGVAREFGIPVGLPVGITPQVDYSHSAVRLDVGGRVVFFTDGLAESRAAAGGCHFQDRMLSEISGPPDTCVGMMRRVVEAEGRHRGGMALRDDLTVLVGAFE